MSAESPDERNARHREQTLRVAHELMEARARTAMVGRALGALLVLAGLALAWAVYEGMAQRATYVAELVFVATWALVLGAVFLVIGTGGAARLGDVPRAMWATLVGGSAVVALVLFTPLARVLAYFAGFDGL